MARLSDIKETTAGYRPAGIPITISGSTEAVQALGTATVAGTRIVMDFKTQEDVDLFVRLVQGRLISVSLVYEEAVPHGGR